MLGSSGSGNATRLSGVQLNSSNYGMPLPIVWGQNRLSTNVIWYGDFKSHQEQQGGKGGGATSYSYTAAVMLAICEGPIIGIPTVYKDTSVITSGGGSTALQQDGLTLSLGGATQPVWSYLTSAHPDQAVGYSGTAWVANSNMSLDSNAGIPNYTFEVAGLLQFGSGIVDSLPSDFIPDALTNPRYGCGFPAASIADMTDYRNYCIAAGFFFSPVLSQQQQIQQSLQDWTDTSNSAIVWSQGQLKIIPYGDQPITGNGVTWTPSRVPLFDLTDDDFIGDGKDPIEVNRSSPSDAYNDYKLQYSDRTNNYNTAPAEAQDQSAIDLYGLRTQDAASAPWICNASTAQFSIQLTLQRKLYLRKQYKFTLPIRYCMLEPMDLITISNDLLGYNKLPVNIIDIQEDDNFNLAITAEDYIVGIGTATPQATQPVNPTTGNQYADPGDVSTPVLFNPPPSLTNGALEVWAAIFGQSPDWGGCKAYVSLNGFTYTYAGTIEGGSRYGVTTTTFPATADPDTTDVLGVDLTASLGELDSGTSAEADAAATLFWIGGELCAYSDVTLTGANQYTLGTYIRRALLGTNLQAHAIGTSWARLDDTIFKYTYNKQQIGKTLHVKFVSFNVHGNRPQDISSVTDYSVTLQPPQLVPDQVSNLRLTTAWKGTSFNVTWNRADNAVNYQVRVYASDGVTLLHTVDTTDTMFSYSLSDATNDGDVERSYVVQVVSQSLAGDAAPTSLTVTKTAPSAVTGVGSTGSGASVTTSWAAKTGVSDLAGYAAFYSVTSGFDPTTGGGTKYYEGTAISAALGGLTPGTTYYVRVAAADQWSDNPAQLNFSAQYSFTA